MYAIRSYYEPLILLQEEQRAVPARPADPEALPEEDPLHWWDIEFAGWNAKKTNIPESPRNNFV